MLRIPISTSLRRGAVAGSTSASVKRVASVSVQRRALSSNHDVFHPTDQFLNRHIGTVGKDREEMLKVVGFSSLDALMTSTIPNDIRLQKDMSLDQALSETEALQAMKTMMSKNKVLKSFIGMGYYETLTPQVISRNILESPGWYTSYTPYQAEISQGRLEMLLNFQTMVSDMVALPMCNASLLDEATAAAEAMTMCYNIQGGKKKDAKFFVDENLHPQNIALLKTRATAAGVALEFGNALDKDFSKEIFCGAMIQYPNSYGELFNLEEFSQKCHDQDMLVVSVTDLMASALVKPVGEMGVDIAVGSAQRFGVPMGFGGPHAAFLATSNAFSRKMPGRLIGVTRDSRGKPALRMAMQTREQHIKRDKATSNICTAQALLANMAAAYGVYHGPEGVKRIATRIHEMAVFTANLLSQNGYKVSEASYFDTFTVTVPNGGAALIAQKAEAAGVNVRLIDENSVGIAFGEAINREDTVNLLTAFDVPLEAIAAAMADSAANGVQTSISSDLRRESKYMQQPVFNSYHSETLMLRYLRSLEVKDISLNFSMMPLGSCTMKLNATSEMVPVTWPEVGNMHPFVPLHQAEGYLELLEDLNSDLAEITGFAAVSSQPNSGAQGEYAGLLAIKAYHKSRNEDHRKICLIPTSAHGTNPASAAMCGMKVIVIKSDAKGNVDVDDLREKAEKHKDNLAALMITYPSTYGVFESRVKEIIDIAHSRGGLVYMDGANMNAQVGLTSPGFIGADVCHLNLHKTFCIPHGGGGPGVGSIGVAARLAPFLPGHSIIPTGGTGEGAVVKSDSAVAAAPFGSASILPITWMYIKLLGESGLKESTGMAVLNANYMATVLSEKFKIAFTGQNGQCAHEFIVDLRKYKEFGIVEEDVAKRLQDYGFHSPTMSWPVGGTIMIEPTESEDKAEMDRFCEALFRIHAEIQDVVEGRISAEDSPLTNAPHTMDMIADSKWDRKYSRETAAFPAPWTNASKKFWPTVGRVDNVFGDRNLVCSCPPMSAWDDDSN